MRFRSGVGWACADEIQFILERKQWLKLQPSPCTNKSLCLRHASTTSISMRPTRPHRLPPLGPRFVHFRWSCFVRAESRVSHTNTWPARIFVGQCRSVHALALAQTQLAVLPNACVTTPIRWVLAHTILGVRLFAVSRIDESITKSWASSTAARIEFVYDIR